jgi:predicted MFS family arabinose efflux permease
MTRVITEPASSLVLKRAICALGITQIIGWGTTYYLPAIFSPAFQRDLGLDSTMVFAAVTVMLVTSAFLGVSIGKRIDRDGARAIMPLGSIVMALGLIALSQASGIWSYLAAWVMLGVAMPMALSIASNWALAQMAGVEAKRAIGFLMLFGGVASSIFWPLTLWLEGLVGWRSVVLIYAAIHLLVCAPLHMLFIKRPIHTNVDSIEYDVFNRGLVKPEIRSSVAFLMIVCFACSGFISWGIDLHLISILRETGLSAALAVGLASLKGPATLMARVSNILLANRLSPISSAIIAAALTITGLLTLLLFGQSLVSAVLFIVIFGFGTGLMTVARATLPLTLLGAAGYATTMGRLSLPTQLVYAASPTVFGLIIGSYGASVALSVGVVASLISLLALIFLVRMIKTPAK